MTCLKHFVRIPLLAVLAGSLNLGAQDMSNAPGAGFYNVKTYGAKGDGATVDTSAINAAIEAAHQAGGGTVFFPAGTYLSFSIRLKSNITLYLDQGSTILAADPDEVEGGYDLPEPNEWDMYQDFGHSHWHNSLIWGENLENISILGPGLIHGKGLTRRSPGPRRPVRAGDIPLSLGGGRDQRTAEDPGRETEGERERRSMESLGNKTIGLKLCRNVVLRDFTVLQGGHFALLATGVDNLTIDNVKVDTNRDGFDIDCCRKVRITNCAVNSPSDDAIVLKSSYGLGFARATENVTLSNCQVSGYDMGTFLDGTFQRTQQRAPDRDGVTGRIKFGTESNGGFKNITLNNCVFDRCRGIALEIVDGGVMEDVSINNIAMREVTSAPIFLRLGNRARGPDNPPIGKMRRISISNLTVYDAEPRFASIISGIPGHPIEDVRLNNIRIIYRGGGTKEDAALEPPENETSYPEPSMFGTIPAYGLFARHVNNLTVSDVEFSFMSEEMRPPVVLNEVTGADFAHVKAERSSDAPFFELRQVNDFSAHGCDGLEDQRLEAAERESL